jgi:hypothetical protein
MCYIVLRWFKEKVHCAILYRPLLTTIYINMRPKLFWNKIWPYNTSIFSTVIKNRGRFCKVIKNTFYYWYIKVSIGKKLWQVLFCFVSYLGNLKISLQIKIFLSFRYFILSYYASISLAVLYLPKIKVIWIWFLSERFLFKSKFSFHE